MIEYFELKLNLSLIFVTHGNSVRGEILQAALQISFFSKHFSWKMNVFNTLKCNGPEYGKFLKINIWQSIILYKVIDLRNSLNVAV